MQKTQIYSIAIFSFRKVNKLMLISVQEQHKKSQVYS